MENGQITAIILASLVCGTITIGLVLQAWFSGGSRGGLAGSSGSSRKERDAIEERLYRLEQAIDTIAIEVERGAEAQRFTAKLLAERFEAGATARLNARAARE